MASTFSEWFWDESIWLPAGFTWADLESTPDYRRPSVYDFYLVPPLAVLFVIIRAIFERYLAVPFCHYLKIKDEVRKDPEPNSICEQFYKLSSCPSSSRIEDLSRQLSWSPSRVRRWFRRKRNTGKPPLMQKATESCWRLLAYTLLTALEFGVLMQTDWALNCIKMFEGFIHKQHLSDGMRCLYISQLAFYISLMMSQFGDVKRKDFWQMFLHHVITIFLIAYSYIGGHFRSGIAIMTVHDVSDSWLEAAKVANYGQMRRTCDALFVIFAIVFYISRWLVYPLWILRNAIFVSYVHVGWYKSYYIIMVLLCVLQVLHIFWGISIARVVYQFAIVGKVEKDVRSEDEESTDEDKDSTKKKTK